MSSNRFLGPLLSVLSMGWLWLAYFYIPASSTTGEPGPRAFPLVLGCALLLLGLAITVSGFARRGEVESTKAAADTNAKPLKHELRIVLGTFGLLILYAFLMEKTGFLVSTPIVLAMTLAGLLRMRRWTFIALMSGGTTLVCWLVFVVVLRVPLPRGSLWWLI
jgi:putative tricarboxylic transport membrane protein